jgi:hypothetical protein
MALFRNEAPALGLGTTLQETSGYAGNPAGAPVVNNYKPTTREFIDLQANAATITATNGVSGYMFTAPWACQVVGIKAVAATPASSSMTIQFYKCPVASQPVAPGGTGSVQLLASALNLDSGLVANTVAVQTLSTTASSLQLAAGDVITYVASGAATGLNGGLIQVEIVQLG